MFPDKKSRTAFSVLYLLFISSLLFSEVIHVELQEKFKISLTGEGWIFMGEQHGKEGVILQSRSFEPGFTVMEFLCSTEGFYTLSFEYQDFVTGENRTESREVVTGSSSVNTGSGGDVPVAEKPESPVRFDLISGESLLEDSRFYLENRDYAKCSGLLASYISGGYEMNEDFFDIIIGMKPASAAESLLAGIDFSAVSTRDFSDDFFGTLTSFITTAGRPEALEPLLSNRLQTASGEEKARAAYKLAEYYHYTALPADLERAATYYNMIYRQYPYSEFWAPARDRLDRMNQHYFQIR